VIEALESLLGPPVALEELKHKPGRRRTLRATGSRRTAIVKLYESDRAPVVAARLGALAAGPPEPVVPRVLHVDPERRLLVLTEVRGTPFRDAIVAEDTAACVRVGAALASWHRALPNVRPDGLAPHTIDDEVRILVERADGAPPEIASMVRSALPELRDAWPCTTIVHRDLYEEQILIGDRVGLIDLDDAALGPPELDLGNLLAHIELLGLRTGDRVAPAIEALLGGYGPQRLDESPLDRCRRLALLRLACIHHEPRLIDMARHPSEVVPA
jgi:Ser/Thr protein kinase RdoA (MazF antagonist)